MAPKQKPAALPPQAQAKNKPAAAKPNRLLPVLVIASIAVIIIGILLLKEREQPAVALAATPTSSPTAQGSSPPRARRRP